MTIKNVSILVLIFMVFGLSSCSAQENKISKPVWNVGDSWKVKCPLMTQRAGEKLLKIGECTVSVIIADKTQFRGTDCYVLQIDSMEDCPSYSKHPDSRFTEFAYYSVDDLRLVRIEHRSSGKDARLLSFANAPSGEQVYSAVAEHSTVIPLLLPRFPVSPGHSAVPFYGENKDKDTLARASKGENVMKSTSVVENAEAVSSANAQDTKSEALKVTFTQVRDRSVSGREESVLMEQVWEPGKKWWSSAHVSDYGGRDEMDFVLVDAPATQ